MASDFFKLNPTSLASPGHSIAGAKSEQQAETLPALFAHAAVGLSEISLRGQFRKVNGEICRLLKRGEQEILNFRVWDITHPDDVSDSMRRFHHLVKNGGRVSLDKRYICSDGTFIWVNSILTRLDDAAGMPYGIVAVTVDLTEHKHAAEALRNSEERLRLIVESAREYAIFSTDLDLYVTSWNKGAERLLGYKENEILGNSAECIYTLEDRVLGIPQMEAKTALQAERANDKRWHIRKDGSHFWSNGFLMSMRDENGKAIGFVKVLHDETEARKIQETLEKRRLELETALIKAEYARKNAETSSKTKDHCLAVLSHELRTPLTPILMCVHMLSKRRDLPADVIEAVEMIQKNIRIEAHFIDELLDANRLARGKIEITPQPVDLHDVIREAVDVSIFDVREKHQELVVSLDAASHQLQGDFNRLLQVFWNLLKNASKFTPDGGRIEVSSRNEDSQIVVEISDTGIGIEPDALKRIFYPFEQADASISKKYGGLGLGLAISIATIEAHSGHLEARSKGKGQGTTFSVRLSVD